MNKILILTSIILLSSSIICESEKVLLISDFHLNLFYNSKIETKADCTVINNEKIQKPNPNHDINDMKDLGKYGCDTNKSLFQVILNKIKEIDSLEPSKISKIIILGDSISHILFKDKENLLENYNQTFDFYKSSLIKTFPEKEILFTIGNNDFTGKYEFSSSDNVEEYNFQMRRLKNSLIQSRTSKIETIFPVIKVDLNKKMTELVLPFYSSHITSKIIGIFLYGNLFSNVKYTKYDYVNLLIQRQKEFLVDQLENIRINSQKAVIFIHYTFHGNYFEGTETVYQNWTDEFLEFIDELGFKYKDFILMVFPSHFHRSKLGIRRKINKNNTFDYYLPSIFIPSISPSFDTNPGFAVVDFKKESIENMNFTFLDKILFKRRI